MKRVPSASPAATHLDEQLVFELRVIFAEEEVVLVYELERHVAWNLHGV